MRRWAILAAVTLMSAAAAPATAPAQGRAQAAERCLGAAGGSALPAAWSNRRKIVHLAVCEWAKFGYQTVEIRPTTATDADSLPASLGLSPVLRRAAAPPPPGYERVRPAIEAQVRFGQTESDRSASPLVETYWSAVRPSLVTAVRRAREVADHAGGASLYPGWWDPWSAAFVSWTYQTAGVPWFRGSASHVLYLQAAMARRPGAVVGISRYKPLPGDLICMPRADAAGQPTALSEAGFLQALKISGEHFDSHCDIVVRVNHASVVSIGGNVNNAVTATVTPLIDGRLMRTSVRPWSAALTLGEPYDPCARIEAVPVPGWRDKKAEAWRRAALKQTGCAAP